MLRFIAVGASFIVMVPTADFFAPSFLLTWLAVAALCVLSVWLFLHRQKLRTLFLIPLCYAPFFSGSFFREHGGYESSGFTISIVLFFLLAIGGLLLDAFWSPYADDIADQEWLSQFKE